MESKLLEIRDRATAFPVLAFEISGRDGYLAQRAGFESRMIFIVNIQTQKCAYSPYNWGTNARTLPEAHRWIENNWDKIKNEDVIDVEFVLGETETCKVSERFHGSYSGEDK